MKIKYNPQRNDDLFQYAFEEDKITVQYHKREYQTVTKETEDGPEAVDELQIIQTRSDTFDFTGLPDGKLEDIDTDLPFNPVISVERKDGVLYVALLRFIGKDATEEERYTDWQEV